MSRELEVEQKVWAPNSRAERRDGRVLEICPQLAESVETERNGFPGSLSDYVSHFFPVAFFSLAS